MIKLKMTIFSLCGKEKLYQSPFGNVSFPKSIKKTFYSKQSQYGKESEDFSFCKEQDGKQPSMNARILRAII